MSGPYSAEDATIAFCEENVFGVLPDPAVWWPPWLTEGSPEPKFGWQNLKTRGVGRDLHSIGRGLMAAQLKVKRILQTYGTLETLDAAWADSERSFYAEVYYLKGSSGVSLRFPGIKFDEVTVACSVEGDMTADCTLKGITCLDNTTKLRSTGIPYTERALRWYDSYVKIATAAIERTTSWKFTVKNHITPVPVIRVDDGDKAKYLPYGQRDVTGELMFEFETRDEAIQLLGDTEFALELGLSGSHKANFSGCKWDDIDLPSKADGPLSLTAPFTAKTLVVV